jgi:hypothetical protein
MCIFKMKTLSSLIVLFFPVYLLANVVAYKAPEGIEISKLFDVSVLQNGIEYFPSCFVTHSTLNNKPELASSFVNFDMKGKVTVKVKLLNNTEIQQIDIRPLSKGIKARTKGGFIFFDVDEPMQLSLEINGNIDHTLLIFANPIEQNPPKPSDADVVYFGPGIHDISAFKMPEGKKRIYIHGNAYVKGNIELKNDVAISGRGIVSGENYVYETNIFRSLVETESVEGIIILNTPYYNLKCRYANWVKCISWYGQTDGVHILPNGLIENCFFKVNDDVFKLYSSNIKVNNCVVWLLYTGAPFQLTWNLMGETRRNIEVNDIDIIHTQYEVEHINRAIINSVHGGNANIDGVTFNNIRVEGDTWRIMQLFLRRTRYGRADTLGNIANITVRNMTVGGKVLHPSKITGIYENERASTITGISFENLVVNGKAISDKDASPGWIIDDKTAEYPTFSKWKHGMKH